jgi:mycothiol system anti-sigma-R factor
MSDETPLTYETCQEALARLFEYLDRALPPAEEAAVRRHLEVCEICIHHFDFEARLLEQIREKCGSGRAPESLRGKVKSLLDAL